MSLCIETPRFTGAIIDSTRGRMAQWVEHWAEITEEMFGDRLLPITTEICHDWARFDPTQQLPDIDGLIAATAPHHRLTLVTRNVADFERSGVTLFNPVEKTNRASSATAAPAAPPGRPCGC